MLGSLQITDKALHQLKDYNLLYYGGLGPNAQYFQYVPVEEGCFHWLDCFKVDLLNWNSKRKESDLFDDCRNHNLFKNFK